MTANITYENFPSYNTTLDVSALKTSTDVSVSISNAIASVISEYLVGDQTFYGFAISNPVVTEDSVTFNLDYNTSGLNSDGRGTKQLTFKLNGDSSLVLAGTTDIEAYFTYGTYN
jgi:hypothetical protein